MKALIKTPTGATCTECPPPALTAPDGVLIRVMRAAICRTDQDAADGRLPVNNGTVLGHEVAGVIEAAGPAAAHCRPGTRVTVNPLLPCQQCSACSANRPHECFYPSFIGLDRDGAFAELLVVPAAQVFPLPEEISFAVGAYAEPLAAVMAVLEAGVPTAGTLTVVGEGRIAELTRLALTDHGRPDHAALPYAEGENCTDCLIETDLSPANAAEHLRMLRPGGTLILKSRRTGVLSFPPLQLIRKRLTLRAVHYAPFPQAVQYLGRAAVRLQEFVGSEWPLECFEQAFAEARASEQRKIYFKPNG